VSTPVLAVPTAAVRADSGSASVLAIVGDRVERRTIVVGSRDNAAGLIEVRSGLAAGDRVVVAPGSGVAPGTVIKLAADSTSDSSRPAGGR